MIDLGFLQKDPEVEVRRKVRFEVPLSALEEDVWTAFHDWVEMVSSMTEIRLMAHVANAPTDFVKRRRVEIDI